MEILPKITQEIKRPVVETYVSHVLEQSCGKRIFVGFPSASKYWKLRKMERGSILEKIKKKYENNEIKVEFLSEPLKEINPDQLFEFA